MMLRRSIEREAHTAAAVERERAACEAVARNRYEQWRMPHPDDAEPGEVCCDVTACADIADAIAARKAPALVRAVEAKDG
jgi:hypothetical protein